MHNDKKVLTVLVKSLVNINKMNTILSSVITEEDHVMYTDGNSGICQAHNC